MVAFADRMQTCIVCIGFYLSAILHARITLCERQPFTYLQLLEVLTPHTAEPAGGCCTNAYFQLVTWKSCCWKSCCLYHPCFQTSHAACRTHTGRNSRRPWHTAGCDVGPLGSTWQGPSGTSTRLSLSLPLRRAVFAGYVAVVVAVSESLHPSSTTFFFYTLVPTCSPQVATRRKR